jgi:hypothetical protein
MYKDWSGRCLEHGDTLTMTETGLETNRCPNKTDVIFRCHILLWKHTSKHAKAERVVSRGSKVQREAKQAAVGNANNAPLSLTTRLPFPKPQPLFANHHDKHLNTTRHASNSSHLTAKATKHDKSQTCLVERVSNSFFFFPFFLSNNSNTGKTGGKTGGKAGDSSKTQKSHSAKAGLQVCLSLSLSLFAHDAFDRLT